MKKLVSLKKLGVMLLCFSLLLVFPTIASARYSYISDVQSSFIISSGGQATCGGEVWGKQIYPVSITVELQQKQSNGSWLTVASWSDSATAYFARAAGSYSVPSGYTYRCYVTGTIYGENGYASVEKRY